MSNIQSYLSNASNDNGQDEAVRTVSLASTWLSSTTYDLRDGSCTVTFKGGYTWQGNMSRDDWESLTTTSSCGRFWHSLMKEGKV